MRSLKVLNRQISWKDCEMHWEADLRHVEILAKHLGLEGASSVKTLGDKNDSDKTFRYRDLDGEAGGQDEESAYYVDELFMKSRHGASPGRIPTSPLTRKDDPKLARARLADIDSEDDGLGVLVEIPASRESRRAADVRCSAPKSG